MKILNDLWSSVVNFYLDFRGLDYDFILLFFMILFLRFINFMKMILVF